MQEDAPGRHERVHRLGKRFLIEPLEGAIDVRALLAQERLHVARALINACRHFIRGPQRTRRDSILQRLEIAEPRMAREPRHRGLGDAEARRHVLNRLQKELARLLDNMVDDELLGGRVGHARGKKRRIGHGSPTLPPL